MNKSPNQLNSQLVRLTKNTGRRCAKRKSTFLRFCQTTQTIFKCFLSPEMTAVSCQLRVPIMTNLHVLYVTGTRRIRVISYVT